MIGVIGKKRFLGAAVLAAINLALAGGFYGYLQTENANLEREVRGLRAQVSEKRNDIERLRLEQKQIEEQKARFETLEAAGFFSDQNRVLARNKIEALQTYTGILSANYNISAAMVEKTDLAAGTDYAILTSPVTLVLEAMDDVDVYNFIFWLENGFPGQVSVNDIRIERPLDINEAVLRQIGSGSGATLIKATVGFNWHTMMSEKALGIGGEGGNGI